MTPFLFPILQFGVSVAFLGCGGWTLLSVISHRALGWPAAIPLATVAVAPVVMLLTPFTDIWLKVNYPWYRRDRVAIVRRIEQGVLLANDRDLVALGSRAPYVSAGGNEVIVEEHGGRRYVFFFTFRGILDN